MENELKHYGTKRHSGRYPWGSGDNPFQHTGDFISRVRKLKKEGLTTEEIAEGMGLSKDEFKKEYDEASVERQKLIISKFNSLKKDGLDYDEIVVSIKKYGVGETEIAEAMGVTTTRLRAEKRRSLHDRRSALVQEAKDLKSQGLSTTEIAKRMNLSGESTVRSLLREDAETRMNISEKTAENLKGLVDERGMIDIGKGFERQLGISPGKLDESVEILKLDGYEVWEGRVPQATNPGKFTTLKVLCPPGTPHSAIYEYDKVNYINDLTSDDNGDTLRKSFVYPESMDSSRLAIRYAEEGGLQKDGVVEIRRGVKDLDLGSNYAQVRILVDGTHYVKGMAVYAADTSDWPEGVDLMFNTNKKLGTSKMDVLKPIKNDPDNPFGSAIKENGGQSYYIGDDGEQHLSLINKRANESDWGEWSKELSSQFLSKQPLYLVKRQIALSESDYEDEFNEIKSLTNPTVKKAMLEDFADGCDSASVRLKVRSFPDTSYKVILPVTSLKDDEVYNPALEDGATVALIRYPHGGTFEIPILKVNNKNKEARSVLTTTPSDAIGINANVAARLSGADFDGDTVMVIPFREGLKITSTPALKELEGFDGKVEYGGDVKIIDGKEHYFRGGKEYIPLKKELVQKEMGVISNLITDMTIKGATEDELARAVKHSMVVIDANKHHLDYKQSEIDNRIDELKRNYQRHIDPTTGEEKYGGASTLLSMSKSKEVIKERKEGAFFDRDTNEPVELVNAGNKSMYVNKASGQILNKKDVKTVYVDPKTGEKLYHDTNRYYFKVKYTNSKGKTETTSAFEDKNGRLYYKNDLGEYTLITNESVKKIFSTQESTKMAETKDALTLVSDAKTEVEYEYANYANKLKSLANQARKEALSTKDKEYSPSARIVYKDQVESLNYKYNQALLNKPKERQAQTIAATIIKSKMQDETEALTSEQKQKIKQQALSQARARVGAKRNPIVLTDKEWEAIQAGAISKSRLSEMIPYIDSDTLKQLAMPRSSSRELSPTKINRIKNMASSGYTTSEIADALGVSTSTITQYMKGGK